MRNLIIQALPAGAVLTIDLDRPMAHDERPIILTTKGKGSAVVQVIDTARVSITNPTREISPFIFFVGKSPNIPAGMHNLIASFLGRV